MHSKSASDKILRTLTKVRKKRIEGLKKQIVSGRYQVNNLALAKALFLSESW